MALYFQDFPSLEYRFGNETFSTNFQNIAAYVDVIDTVKDNIKEKLSKFSLRDTVNMIVSETGLSKKVIYNEAIKINNENINTKK